jgi:hypothetical protein
VILTKALAFCITDEEDVDLDDDEGKYMSRDSFAVADTRNR